VTSLERAQHIAHLLGGNGLSQNQQVELVAKALEEWKRADREVWENDRELMDEIASGR
jgi:hypothetical protein